MPKGHCLDYWHKWRKEYNFCGLRDQDAKENDKYLSLVDMIAGNGAGLDGDFILEHFTAGAARPLVRCKDDAAYEKTLNYVVACLKKGETITGGDLAATINTFIGKSTQLRTEKPPLPVEEQPVDPPKTVAQIDQEQARKQEVQEDAKSQQPAFTTAKELPPSPPDLTPPCKSGKPCPGDRNYLVKQKVLGDKCDAGVGSISTATYCPVLRRQYLASPEGQAAVAVTRLDMAKPIKMGGIRIVKTPLTCEELNQCADDLIERSGFFTEKEVGLVDELIKARYEGIRTRADFLKKAANWFLTSAGEE
jgi:hypothetical protein